MSAAEVLQEITDRRPYPRRHPAEVTASRIVDHMKRHRSDLTDRDVSDLNNAAHVLYRLADRQGGRR